MRFKKYSTVLISLGALLGTLSITGCNNRYKALPEENIIGLRLDSVNYTSGVENEESLSMFDETTRRIHTFDLTGGGDGATLKKSFEVLGAQDDHYVIASNDSSFLVDLSQSQLSIYRYDGTSTLDVVPFRGKPISSAYSKQTGHLIIYDNLNSVSLLKINSNGDITNLWIGGPLVTGRDSILAGEISAAGDLILSLDDGTLAIVDIDGSIEQEKWVYTIDAVIPRREVSWIAAVSDNLILYQSSEKLVLYDYVLKVVISEKNYPTSYQALAYGKTKDAHVIYSKKRTFSESEYLIAYVEGGEIKIKKLRNQQEVDYFGQSRLDLSENEFSYIGAKKSIYERHYKEDKSLSRVMSERGRTAVSYRFTDMLATSRVTLPDDAKLKKSKNFVLALFPSELGYVEKINIKTDELEVLKNFNILYIDQNLVSMKSGK